MSASLGLTIVLYALALAAIGAGVALSGRPRPPAFALAVGTLEIALIGQALLDVLALADGRAANVATNLGYLLTSLAVLPICAGSVRFDTGRWGTAALAVGCVLVVVVTLRLHQTAGSAHA